MNTAALFALRLLQGLLVLAALPPASALAQGTVPLQGSSGWSSDAEGMRHFSGLRCPDEIGQLFRTKVLASDGDRMAGCVYTGPDGMSAVLRQHLSGTGQIPARQFAYIYGMAGFERVALTGPAAEGISFKTRSWTSSTLCETLWYFAGASADYTLWMAYALPAQEEDIGPALDGFVRLMNRLR